MVRQCGTRRWLFSLLRTPGLTWCRHNRVVSVPELQGGQLLGFRVMDNYTGNGLVTGHTTGNADGNKPRLALVELTFDERWALIALAAYFRAEKRGFAPGRELQDWLEAEREIFP